MRTESLDAAYLALPDGAGPHPGIVVVHEAFGLNDNIRGICRRLAAEGYAALGVDLFQGRNRAACMARMFLGAMTANPEYYGVPALKAALGRLAGHPGVDAARIGAVGFCLGGSIILTWACTDSRLTAIAPFYGAAPRPRNAIRRLCPVVGSWPGKDITTRAAGVLETGLTAAGWASAAGAAPYPALPPPRTGGYPPIVTAGSGLQVAAEEGGECGRDETGDGRSRWCASRCYAVAVPVAWRVQAGWPVVGAERPALVCHRLRCGPSPLDTGQRTALFGTIVRHLVPG